MLDQVGVRGKTIKLEKGKFIGMIVLSSDEDPRRQC